MPSQESVDKMSAEVLGFLESKKIWDLPYMGLPKPMVTERTLIFLKLRDVIEEILKQDACEKF